MMAMFPVIIVLMMLIAISIVVFQWVKPKGRPPLLRGHVGKWLILGYSAILLVSVLMYYVFIKPNIIYSEQVEMTDWFDMYPYASGLSDLSELKAYKKDSQSYPFVAEQLNLTVLGALYGDPLFVRVEKSEMLKEQIELDYYESPTAIDGIDISIEVPKVEFNMVNDELTMSLPEQTDIYVTSYKNEFPFNQFINDQFDFYINVLFPERLIVLRVPENLRVVGNDMVNIYEVN